MRSVFDTNVVLSALLFEESKPAQAFFAALTDGEILLSVELAHEINRVLLRKKFDRYLTIDQRELFLAELVETSRLVEITETINACRDSKDNMILELAVSGQADAIITGDGDLLVLHPFRSVPILTPETFLKTFPKNEKR
jgi:putative PIN family toxin of toxin-antitoxin system